MVQKLFLLSLIFIALGCRKSKSDELPLTDISFDLQQDTSYSFSLENNKYTEHIIDITVRVGSKSSESRKYALFVTDDGDATSNDYTLSGNFSIHPNGLTDRVRVVLHRNTTLQSQNRLLVLRLVSNNYFRVRDNAVLRIQFDDIISIPSWWKTWQNQFGPFYKEKLVAWKEIYKQGLDKEGYYWDKMPPYAMQEHYPTTFMYIRKLKTYFEENIVYPNNDEKLNQIKIP